MDSDQYDEVEAALEARAAEQAEALMHKLPGIRFETEPAVEWGTLEILRPRMFKLYGDVENAVYINLALVTGVRWRANQQLTIYCGAEMHTLTANDQDAIARFWEQWEVV